MNAHFVKANFVGSYFDKEMAFYSRFFQNENEELKFFEEVFKNDGIDNTPRRMMNITERWVSFADDLEKIRPGCDALRILCYRVCIEGLHYLNGEKDTENPFFETNLVDEDKNRLRDLVSTLAAYKGEEDAQIPLYKDRHPLDVYTRLIRNDVVHKGAFSLSEFFSGGDYGVISSVEDRGKEKELIYETDLNYEDFRDSFVRASINMIKKYLDKHKKKKP